MADKKRLDAYLADTGLAETREKAKAKIISGQVYVDGVKAEKPAMMVDGGSAITIKPPECEFVSRGGYKLKKALEVFHLDVSGSIAVDIGASTGGFTDCLIKNGAAKVYAVDVGYGQLDWRLRTDSRVVVKERQNARYLTPEDIGESADICVADVSFISLKLILPVAKSLIKEEGRIVTLIKPQFEAGRGEVGKKGVVRDPAVHQTVLKNILDFARGIGLACAGLDHSPIKGPNGNIEYIACFIKGESAQNIGHDVENVVKTAHLTLKSL